MYVYKKVLETETEVYQTTGEIVATYEVGFYAPDGRWVPESQHSDSNEAAHRVHWLNGGEWRN